MTENGRPATILIVEDEYIIGLDLAGKLEEIGYLVCGLASNGETCLELAAREHPDMILMDIALQGDRDGIELADTIRRQLDIPVVFITARVDKHQLQKAKIVLPFGYLIKPFQHKDLQVAVEMALYFSRIDRERRDAEAALKESEEKYRLVVENPLNAIAVFQDHRIVFANRKLLAAAEDFQVDHTHRSYLDFVHPEDLNALLERAVKRRNGQDLPETVEFRLIAPDGRTIWIEASGAMVDWEGRPAHLICFRNISEHVAAKEALQASETQQRQLLNQLPDPILVLDRTTYCFLDCNQAAVEHYGYTREELLQMTPFDLHAPEEHDLVRFNIEDETDNKPHHYTHLTKTGQRIQVETHTSTGTFQGRPAWITIIRDITERLRAENLTGVLYGLLRAAHLAADLNEYYRMIHQNIGDIIDAKNFFIAMYDPAADTISFPYFVDQMDNRFEITDAYDSGSLAAEVIRTGRPLLLDENGIRQRYEPTGISPWGTLSKCWLGVPLTLQGQAFGALGVQSYLAPNAYGQSDMDLLETVSHQISLAVARKQAEDAYRKSAEQARVLLNTPYMMAMLVEADGTILDINRTGALRLGKSPADLIGTNASGLEPRTQSTAGATKAVEVLTTGQPVSFDQDVGDWCLQTSMYPIADDNGVVTQMAVFTRDISEQKQAENKLKATLEEKEVLLREIHHRVKNNMQVIISLLNLQTMGQNDPGITEALLESQSRVGAMALVHETLYQSDSLAGVDLKKYITGLVRLLSSAYGGRHLELKIEVEAEDGLAVGLDQAVPCGLVLHELVSNALKHAFPAGRPGIVKIGAAFNHPHTMEISVRDNGRGWPPNLDWRNCGSLGLKLVLSLVEGQLGGKLAMIQDHGTTFICSIPRP
jgi:PAS domain S-box-containing protein